MNLVVTSNYFYHNHILWFVVTGQHLMVMQSSFFSMKPAKIRSLFNELKNSKPT